jgi:hypothetical protein
MNTEKKNTRNLLETIIKRAGAPTPPFFRYVKLVGLSLAAAGGAIIAAPVALPPVVITVAGYLIAAGSVAAAVSQVAVEGEESGPKKNETNKH